MPEVRLVTATGFKGVSTMTALEFLQEYYWVFLLAIPLGYIFVKWSSKRTALGLNLKDMALVIEYGFYLLVIVLVEKYLFPDNNYFTVAVLLFTAIWSGFIFMLLAGNDIYVLESTFQNELFHQQGEQPLLSESTSHRLLVMDRSVYDKKKHVGEASYKFWQGTDRLKFTDYYNDKTGTFFHPEIDTLHNISFYQAKAFWLWLKERQPRLERENIKLTWLSDNKLAHEQNVIKDNYEQSLMALKRQYKHDPMTMPDDIDKFKQLVIKEASTSQKKTEQPTDPDPDPEGQGGEAIDH